MPSHFNVRRWFSLSLVFPSKWFVVGTLHECNLALVYYQNVRIIRHNETEMWWANDIYMEMKRDTAVTSLTFYMQSFWPIIITQTQTARATLSTFAKYIHLTWRHWEISFTRRIIRWKWWKMGDKMKRFIASICAYLNAKLQPKIVNKFNTIHHASL